MQSNAKLSREVVPILQFFGVLPFPYVLSVFIYIVCTTEGSNPLTAIPEAPNPAELKQNVCAWWILPYEMWPTVLQSHVVTCSFGDQVWARKAKWKHIQKYLGHRQGSKTHLTSLTSLTSGYIQYIPSGWSLRGLTLHQKHPVCDVSKSRSFPAHQSGSSLPWFSLLAQHPNMHGREIKPVTEV